MNMLDALLAANNHIQEKKRTNPGHKRSREVLQQNSDARWKKAFGDGKHTTAKLAGKFGYSHMGALSSLYKLEERKKVKRAGTVPSSSNKPAILWQWVGD